MRKIYPWILCILAPCFLKLCAGNEVTCTVSVDARGVVYSVPEFEAAQCWHSWSDENNIVVANHQDQDKELVVKQTNQTLILKKCKLIIRYKRNCLSERGPFRATCDGPCVTSAYLPPLASHQTSLGFIAFVIPVILVLLVGVVLCFVFRARICREDCFYSALKRPDIQNRRQSMEEGIPF